MSEICFHSSGVVFRLKLNEISLSIQIGLRHSKRYSKIKELNHLHNMFLILLYSLPYHLSNWLVLPFSGLFNINYLVSNGVFKLMYIVLFVLIYVILLHLFTKTVTEVNFSLGHI